MPDMSILEFVSQSMPFAVFVLVILAIVNTLINVIMWWMIAGIKKGVVWQDEFKQFDKNITDRIESLERVRNGT